MYIQKWVADCYFCIYLLHDEIHTVDRMVYLIYQRQDFF